MVLSLVVFSQQANNDLESETINLLTNSSSANNLLSHFNSSSVTPIWSEDFSAGFPALWSTSSSNMGGGFATFVLLHSIISGFFGFCYRKL